MIGHFSYKPVSHYEDYLGHRKVIFLSNLAFLSRLNFKLNTYIIDVLNYSLPLELKMAFTILKS